MLNIDPWDLRALIESGVAFDVVVLDVARFSGRDSLLDSIALANNFCRGFPLRTIVCRSKALQQLAHMLMDSSLLTEGKKVQRLYLERGEERDGSAPPRIGSAISPVTAHKVVCATGVLEYRSTIPHVIRDGDHVLEIGCQMGKSTKLIKQANKSGRVVGSDVAASSIDQAIRLGQGFNVEWVVLDGWDLHGIKTLGAWDVIYVDISGISGINSVQDAVALITSYFRLLPQLRTVVVKSKPLRDLSVRFVNLDPLP